MTPPRSPTAEAAVAGFETAASCAPSIPRYLEQVYWWAYVHPNAVALFEREWLVSAILFGHYGQLRDAALALKLKPGLAGLRPDSTAHANLARAIHIEHERGQIAAALNQAILARAANDQSMAPASAFQSRSSAPPGFAWPVMNVTAWA